MGVGLRGPPAFGDVGLGRLVEREGAWNPSYRELRRAKAANLAFRATGAVRAPRNRLLGGTNGRYRPVGLRKRGSKRAGFWLAGAKVSKPRSRSGFSLDLRIRSGIRSGYGVPTTEAEIMFYGIGGVILVVVIVLFLMGRL